MLGESVYLIVLLMRSSSFRLFFVDTGESSCWKLDGVSAPSLASLGVINWCLLLWWLIWSRFVSCALPMVEPRDYIFMREFLRPLI